MRARSRPTRHRESHRRKCLSRCSRHGEHLYQESPSQSPILRPPGGSSNQEQRRPLDLPPTQCGHPWIPSHHLREDRSTLEEEGGARKRWRRPREWRQRTAGHETLEVPYHSVRGPPLPIARLPRRGATSWTPVAHGIVQRLVGLGRSARSGGNFRPRDGSDGARPYLSGYE
jgi:hypothetical protein